MKKYVETHAGNPAVVKFWENALSKGLDLDHTADSLRHHWIKVLPNKNSPVKPIAIPAKRINDKSPFSSPQKRIKEEKIKLPDEDEMKSIRVVVQNSKRVVYDFEEINFKCEEENVDLVFDRLVETCSKISGKRLSKQEVLKALLARNGVVKTTIEHFSIN